MNPHTELVNSLLLALGSRPDLGKFWKQNTGAIQSESGAYIRYGLPGSADITGILSTGCRVEIECKTGGGVQSKQQKNFEAMILRYGGIYLVARGIKETLTELEARCGRS